MESEIAIKEHYFLQGGGEMGKLIREKDWSKTPLGEPNGWPQSLRTMVAVMLDNPFGTYIAWGKDYTQLYNDGYRPILGSTKHPKALGISTRETFEEIWHIIGTMFDNVMKGIPIGFPDFMLPLNRNGFVEECYFDFSYSPIRKEDGEVGGVLVTVIETTSKKLIGEALKKSEANLRNTIMQAPVAMCIFRGPNHIVELANERMFELWGKPGEAFLNKPIWEGLPEGKNQGFEELLNGVYETGNSFSAQELPITLLRNGKIALVYVNFNYEAYRDADGTVSGILAVATDVTEQVLSRKKIEESEKTLSEKNKELLKTNNDLDNFIYTASHDLKAPISNIEGLLNSLKDILQFKNEVDDDVNVHFDLIQSSINRFSVTIRDLTEITKVQKVEEVDINELDLSKIIEDVKISIYDKIRMSKAIIKTDFSSNSYIRFSRKNLNSIIYNLLTNAIKYRDKEREPEILISTQNTEEYLILSVQDNGLGINEQSIAQMFSMFKRFHDHVEGTGIGLYIVKRIIDNAGGKIEVESEVGKGTIFKVYFKR